MTKHEWETELKKCLRQLPKDEQNKVLAYYHELYADQSEAGKSEKQILNEFGNPADAAEKIMSDYGCTLPTNPLPRKASTPGSFATTIFIMEVIIFIWVLLAAVVVIWSIVATILTVGYAMIAASIISLFAQFSGGIAIGVRLVYAAVTLVSFALAGVVVPHTIKICQGAIKATSLIWKLLFGWYFKKQKGELK